MKRAGYSRGELGRRSGMALVLVLSALVLLSVLFAGYFSMVMRERMMSRGFAVTAAARELSESAVNVVMAQIQEATTRQPDMAWTSQPGMIRTFDDGGKPVRAYKLFSSDRMVVEGKYDARAARQQELPEDWKSRAGEFVDLNAPVYDDGAWRYPIVDPAAESHVTGFAPDERDGVAMPVRWIYVLRDGTLAPGVWTGEGHVRVGAATKDNPITGRIAFWTDDETCKVDINTASEGVFWDWPRTQSAEDRKLASSQPVEYEFQRFPGHPATVCLSAVFPELAEDSTPRFSKMYALAPRIGSGGSAEGSVDILTKAPSITRDNDRLYASLDELLYSVKRGSNSGLTAGEIDRARFFLTVASRSPELNLFNRPRVALWPVNSDPAKRSFSDGLMALCSSLPGASGARFYFTRSDSRDPAADYANDPGNQKLYGYLRGLTSLPVPGFGGGNLESKYGKLERDQILTEIFDAIRCTNITDPNLSGIGTYSGGANKVGQGQVLPIEITTDAGATRGFGRFATISEAAIDFYAMAKNGSGEVTKMGAALLFSTSTPGQGYTANNADYSHRVTTTKPFKADAQSFSFQGENAMSMSPSKSKYPANDSPLGGDEGFGHTFTDSGYSLVVKNIPVSGGTFSFGGGRVKVEIVSNNHVVQTVEIEFPAVTSLPAPQMPTGSYSTWTNYGNRAGHTDDLGFFQFDTVRSVEVSKGDVRQVAALKSVPLLDASGLSYFAPGDAEGYASDATCSFGLRDGSGHYYKGAQGGGFVSGVDYAAECRPKIPFSTGTAQMANGGAGDWDNGPGDLPDGAYIGKTDAGCAQADSAGKLPYYNARTDVILPTVYFTQREMASPVALGSLPTGVIRRRPWETLLFCPNPAAGSAHPGLVNPPDYLWLDLFAMPTVEPYALSEPFSASGRINLNYEMVPFTGMTRTTGLRAALKSTRIMAIPTGAGAVYKKEGAAAASYRYDISADETLKGMEARFAAGDVFRSAAEICSIFLVPANAPGSPTADSIAAWWQDYKLTGDNTREMPYNHLYPLLTTQSNCYTVHFRVQTLAKVTGQPGFDPQVWEEGKDVVQGEYRGSSLIERRIDPEDSRLGQIDVFSRSLTPYYRFRVMGTAPFAL